MADWAYSDDPHVQAQLDRLNAMTAGKDMLGRSRLRRLLARLGNPEKHLAPTFHVAGTNGKGSTCTYLRTAIAAAGMTAHVYTSPHLVRLNERIRIANRLIGNAELAATLADVLNAAGDDETTFFEATTAVAFLAFSRVKADACIVEVGIGGRLDATNVLPTAATCGIASLGIDHQAYLGDTLEEIAAEKAGIAKPGIPLVAQAQPAAAIEVIARVAASADAPLLLQNRDWSVEVNNTGLVYRDQDGDLLMPAPALAGLHQANNAGLAIAMLRSQTAITVPPGAVENALVDARWPARLTRLGPGPMRSLLSDATRVWLDGAHNVAAMQAVVDYLLSELTPGESIEIVIALLKDKDLAGLLACLARLPCRIYAVPIVGYDARSAEEIACCAYAIGIPATPYPDVPTALRAINGRSQGDHRLDVLITGSLYLAGEVLRLNREFPD